MPYLILTGSFASVSTFRTPHSGQLSIRPRHRDGIHLTEVGTDSTFSTSLPMASTVCTVLDPGARLPSSAPPSPPRLARRGSGCGACAVLDTLPRWHVASVACGLGVRPPSVGFAKLPTTLPLKQNPPALCPAGNECVTRRPPVPRGSHAVTPVQEATLVWLWLCQLPEALVSFHGFQDAQLSSVPIQLFKFCFP